MLTVSGKAGRPNTSSTACSSDLSSPSIAPSVPTDLPPLRPAITSARACIMAPAPPPMVASSSTPASINSASASYPRALRFCNIAAAASCAPSATPVVATLRMRFLIPFKSLASTFSSTLATPGI